MRFFSQPTYQRAVSQFELMGVKSGDTVLLGDSLTEGGSWHELFPQSQIRNRGIGGDMTAGVIGRLDKIAAGQPAQIFLMIGTNDLAGRIPQSEIVANILKIVEIVQEASPRTELYIQSLLPKNKASREQVKSLNSALEAAITGKAVWVNLYPLFLDETGARIASSLSNDDLHLLGPGYLVWRDAIAHLVNRR